MKYLDNLIRGKFLEISEVFGCDGGLPPGCDCICHTPCDFGRAKDDYVVGDSTYKSGVTINEIYEL